MSTDRTSRRSVLKLSGTTLAALGGVTGTAGACIGCGGDGGGDDGGGGTSQGPSVSTRVPSISGNDVEFNGVLDSTGDGDSADCWFKWGEEGAGLPNDTNIQILEDPQWYTDYRTLSSGTYEVQAFASNTYGHDEGAVDQFTV